MASTHPSTDEIETKVSPANWRFLLLGVLVVGAVVAFVWAAGPDKSGELPGAGPGSASNEPQKKDGHVASASKENGKWTVKAERFEAAEVRHRPRAVRPPTVAGQFYPADAKELYAQVESLLTARPRLALRGVHSILVPHAGYVFSAPVAAASFREVDPNFKRVFILAANHNGGADFSGVSIPDATHYRVPGVDVPISPIADELMKDPLFSFVPAAHSMHMIEVELPFIHFLRGRPKTPDYSIIPMVAGRLGDDGISRLSEILTRYADDETLFVFSVDLSHYYQDSVARRLDEYTVQSIQAMDEKALARATTDGNHVLRTMVALAKRNQWEPTVLMSQNSGDASGDKSRVVGYASAAFHEAFSLNETEQRELLSFARRTIEAYVRHKERLEPDAAWLEANPILRIPRGVFVTLQKHGQLRGCIGRIITQDPLIQNIRDNAINAATRDSRFPSVRPGELDDLEIEISVLDQPKLVEVEEPEDYLSVLRPGIDGVILEIHGRQSTFLPSVWEQLPDPEHFLQRLSMKQGAPPDAWRDPSTVLYRYGTFAFEEHGHH